MAIRVVPSNLFSILKALAKALVTVLAALFVMIVFVISLQYAVCPIYDFPESKPFAGNFWFNPYQNTNGNDGNNRWFKANFHAHSKAWSGLTNGKQTREELDSCYRALGYDIIGISNYHDISPLHSKDSSYVPVYEHGYNVRKSHRLAIGAREVTWIDFPLGQTLHHKQYILNRLKSSAEVVAIAHPRFVNGHAAENFCLLTGYDCIEVLNHFRTSDEHWDSALSNGHAKWVLADDDTHDIREHGETGAFWTMIHASSRCNTNIYEALRNGSNYGVRGRGGINDNPLKNVTVRGDTLRVELEHEAQRVDFIGNRGTLRDSAVNTRTALYILKPEDTYIRAVVHNAVTTLYLNPVVRWDGIHAPHTSEAPATVNLWWTWVFRVFCMAFYCTIFTVLFRKIRSGNS